jgi:hypothetical protein
VLALLGPGVVLGARLNLYRQGYALRARPSQLVTLGALIKHCDVVLSLLGGAQAATCALEAVCPTKHIRRMPSARHGSDVDTIASAAQRELLDFERGHLDVNLERVFYAAAVVGRLIAVARRWIGFDAKAEHKGEEQPAPKATSTMARASRATLRCCREGLIALRPIAYS